MNKKPNDITSVFSNQPSTIEANSSYASILQRMESGHVIALAQSKALLGWVLAFGYIVGLITLVKGAFFDWTWHILAPLLVGVGCGLWYYTFSLRRWHKMITSIRTGDYDGDGKPDIPGKKVIYIRVKDSKDNQRVVATEIPEDWKSDILTVARAFNADPEAVRGLTSQATMRKNNGIGRKRLERIVQMFLELNIVEKKGDKPNDPYILKEDVDSREIMRKIAYHDFTELNEVWKN